MTDPEFLYRYERAGRYDDNYWIKLLKLPVLKKTQCGYWVDYYGCKKFCLVDGKFAQPTVEKAQKAFRRRAHLARDFARARYDKAKVYADLADANLFDGPIKRTKPWSILP